MKTPEIITRYIDAANRLDADAAALCFTADAHVHDENHDHRGQDAVRAWVRQTSEQYRPRTEVLTTEAHGDSVRLTVRASGTFPGSPIELDYAVTLRDGKISTLTIG